MPNRDLLELHRFGSVTEVPKDRLGQWCYLLKKIESLTEIPAELKDDPVFQEVFRRAALANLTTEEMKWYSQRRKERNDAYSLKMTYKREGVAQGIAKGKVDGVREARLEIAKAMKKENYSFRIIASITGLACSAIEEL